MPDLEARLGSARAEQVLGSKAAAAAGKAKASQRASEETPLGVALFVCDVRASKLNELTPNEPSRADAIEQPGHQAHTAKMLAVCQRRRRRRQ